MTQKDKTKEKFVEEINSLKKRIAELESVDSKFKQQQQQQQQQQQIDNALQKSEAELRVILDATPFPIALVDTQDNKINYWSSSATTIFGHTAPTASEWYKLAYPDPSYRNQVITQWKLALEKAKSAGQSVNTGEYQITCRDGSVRICELFATFRGDKLIVTFNDITGRKKAEDTLRESEIHYRELVQNTNSAIIRWRKDGTIVFFNEYALKFFGYSLNEIIGKNISILVPQKETTGRDLNNLIKNIIDYPDQYINNINENICRDGRRVWLAWTNKPILNDQGQVEEILCIGSDITERKQAEEALKVSEAMFKGIASAAPVGLGIASNRVIHWVNGNLFKMIGRQKEEIIGCSARIFYENDEGYDRVGRQFYADLKEKGEAEIEVNWKHKDGSVLNVFLTGVLLYQQDLSKGIVFTVLDITGRKKAEKALQESENRFKDVLYSSKDAILLIDDNIFMDCNEAAARMLGYLTREEFLMAHPSKLSPDKQPDGKSSFEKAEEMMKIAVEKGYHRFEWMHKKVNGKNFLVEVSLTPVSFHGKIVIHCVWRDLTDVKKTEEVEQGHLKELEVFYKAAMGREERIVELKKEVEDLKNKLAQ